MIKWDVIFTPEMFYYWYHDRKQIDVTWDELDDFRKLVRKHNIVLSSSLRDEYDNYFYENAIEEIEDMENFLSELVSYAPETEIGLTIRYVSGTEGASLEDKLISTSNSKQVEHPIIVCDKIEQKRRILKAKPDQIVIEREKVTENRIGNRMRRNSGLMNTDLYPDEIDEYKEWIKECFHHEKSIDIFDPYLFADNGLETFKRYYIRNIERGASINIYVQKGKGDPQNDKLLKELETVVQQYKQTLCVYVDNKYDDDYHERRIFLNTSRHYIILGRGTANIKFSKTAKNNTEELKDCHFATSNDLSYKKVLLSRYKFTLEMSIPDNKTAGSES